MKKGFHVYFLKLQTWSARNNKHNNGWTRHKTCAPMRRREGQNQKSARFCVRSKKLRSSNGGNNKAFLRALVTRLIEILIVVVVALSLPVPLKRRRRRRVSDEIVELLPLCGAESTHNAMLSKNSHARVDAVKNAALLIAFASAPVSAAFLLANIFESARHAANWHKVDDARSFSRAICLL